MRVISKVTGMLWRSATLDEKEQYENLALQVQNVHSERYPNYKYKPTSRAKTHPALYQPYMIPQAQIVPALVNPGPGQIFPAYSLSDMLMFTQNDVDLYPLYTPSIGF